MSLDAGSKRWRLEAGETWELGVGNVGTDDVPDHIDVIASAVFDVTYSNTRDSNGDLITDPVTEELDPVRYEASPSKVVVTSGVVRLIKV